MPVIPAHPRPVVLCVLAWMGAASVGAVEAPRVAQPYLFTDEVAAVALAAGGSVTATVAFDQRLLTAAGWGATRHGEAAIRDGIAEVSPLGEGINIATFAHGLGEVRFLAMDPPLPLAAQALRATLPRGGERLAAGEPFSILAMGDSVTATGNHAGILARLLARATGNRRITVVNRSYPGRSADAAARFLADDLAAAGERADLGLLMYGLNDQVCFVALDAYLEHYRFLAERLAAQGGDMVFLQPTPHISIPVDAAARKPESDPPWFVFRTIGFAESLRPLAGALKVPLAETFAAVWGAGGDGIEASARAMWPVYPLGYDRQMTSLIERAGEGDTIHPNALGHLAIARAVFAAIAGEAPATPLRITGISRWEADGVHSTLTVTNATAQQRSGRLEVHPLLEAELSSVGRLDYRLAPGASTTIDVRWAQARRPEDLLRFPADIYLAPGDPQVPVLDASGGGSRVYAAAAPFAVEARFIRSRQVCTVPRAELTLSTAAGASPLAVDFPPTAVARTPVVHRVAQGADAGWAVAEVASVRYAGALPGEAEPDGDLAEWSTHLWSLLGDPLQARWVRGREDHRAGPEECRLRWSCKAGARSLYLALRAEGAVAKDSFIVFLDPREPALLGTVGRYYWLGGSLGADGAVALSAGETSPPGVALRGRWRAVDGRTEIELEVPYALCGASGWPASGDLGLSLWWTHRGPAQQITQLQWSEDGHPWNPRWYGVVRVQQKPDAAALPWMVRVR